MNKFFDIDLEKGYLASLLINEENINSTIDMLNEEDFYDNNHKNIFWAIKELTFQNILVEFNSIVNQLNKDPKRQIPNIKKVLSEIIPWASFEKNFLFYPKEILNYSKKRKVKIAFDSLNNEIQKGDFQPLNVLEKLERELIEISLNSSSSSFQDANILSQKAIEEMEKRSNNNEINGIATNYVLLDKITNGFQPGDLVIIAARPSMGKTAFALNLASRISKKHSIAFFSYEMPSLQLINRIFGFVANVEGNKIKETKNLSKEEWQKIYLAKDKIKSLKLYFDDITSSKINDIVWKCKQLQKESGLDLIIIDYLQLINTASSNQNNRQLEVSYISRQLKLLATELKITVIALSQLSRKVEQREDKIPMMSDLRESGSIEQDADIIGFLYREEYYQKNDSTEHDSSYTPNFDFQKVELIIAKNRNGAIGSIEFLFNPSTGAFLTQKIEKK